MGRPRNFDENQALDSAMHQFWSKGYEATSLQDLLGAMNLSKSSFYQTFISKHELLQRSINHYRQKTVATMLSNLQHAESGLQYLTETLMSVADGADLPGGRRGCLVMNCATEFAQSDQSIAQLVAEGVSDFRQAFYAGVLRAQREGDISPEKDAQVLANFLVSCKSGLDTMAKAGVSFQKMKEVVHVMISALA